jgi:hypothetical protein
VRAARGALGIAAEHSRDLLHAIGIGEQRDVGGRDAGAGSLRDEDVAVRARRDLREMRDREDLVRPRDLA